MSLTSVIIPARNEQDHIAKTIESYKKQQFEDFKVPYEMIVVVNGNDPKDDTPNIAEDLGAKVVQLYEPNVSWARNVGVEESSGEILVFNDADTLVAKNYLQAINQAVKKGSDFGSALFKPENYHPVTLIYSLLAFGSGAIMHDAGGNMYVRRSVFESMNGFDENLSIGEDTDLSRRIKAADGKHQFLFNSYVTTSMRKFEERGYFRELFVNQILPYLKSWKK